MMKLALLALACVAIAPPVDAFERMLRSDCQVSVERIADMASPDNPSTPAMLNSIRVTPQGWCQLRGGDQGLEGAAFKTLEWRADDVKRWTRDGIPPLAIEVRITGLDPDDMEGGVTTKRPDLTVEALVRQLPDAGMIVIERAVMFNGAGDSLSVSGVFERVFLSSPSMMQVSMGSATFKAGLMSMTLDGTHENPFGFDWDVDIRANPSAQSDLAFDVLSRLPAGVMSDGARAELTGFAGDLPSPVGTLEVSVDSARGLGIMQIGMSAYSGFVSGTDDDDISTEMDILFDGLSVEANWSPVAQVAD